MSSRDDSFLYDMLLEARRIGRFVKDLGRAELDEDETRRYALLHAITLFGEAAYHVSSDRREAHPELPWAKIVGMRHRLVHAYGDVDLDIVWDVATRDVPALLPTLEGIVEGLGPVEEGGEEGEVPEDGG